MHNIKSYGGSDSITPFIIKLGARSRRVAGIRTPAHFTLVERSTGKYWRVSWVDKGADRDDLERENLWLHWESNRDTLGVQPSAYKDKSNVETFLRRWSLRFWLQLILSRIGLFCAPAGAQCRMSSIYVSHLDSILQGKINKMSVF